MFYVKNICYIIVITLNILYLTEEKELVLRSYYFINVERMQCDHRAQEIAIYFMSEGNLY